MDSSLSELATAIGDLNPDLGDECLVVNVGSDATMTVRVVGSAFETTFHHPSMSPGEEIVTVDPLDEPDRGTAVRVAALSIRYAVEDGREAAAARDEF